MARVKSANTQPEIFVRSLVHRLGYRFRIHRRDLPGTPDLALPKYRTVVFVHGCFWHQHNCSRGRRQPTSNPEYWIPKLARNVSRDAKAKMALQQMGWRVLTIWECQLRKPELANIIDSFLRDKSAHDRAPSSTNIAD